MRFLSALILALLFCLCNFLLSAASKFKTKAKGKFESQHIRNSFIKHGNLGRSVLRVSPYNPWSCFSPRYRKIRTAKDTYGGGFRKVAGDGNCFYRSFAFQILERIIESEETSLVMIDEFVVRAQNIFDRIEFPEDKYKNHLRSVTSILRNWSESANRGATRANEATIKALLNSAAKSSDTDVIINLLRMIASAYFQFNCEDMAPFIWLPNLRNIMDPVEKVRLYCKQKIEKNKEFADNDVIKAFAQIFGCRFDIINLNSTNDNVIDYTNISPVFGKKPFGFLFSPLHFDIAYLDFPISNVNAVSQHDDQEAFEHSDPIEDFDLYSSDELSFLLDVNFQVPELGSNAQSLSEDIPEASAVATGNGEEDRTSDSASALLSQISLDSIPPLSGLPAAQRPPAQEQLSSLRSQLDSEQTTGSMQTESDGISQFTIQAPTSPNTLSVMNSVDNVVPQSQQAEGNQGKKDEFLVGTMLGLYILERRYQSDPVSMAKLREIQGNPLGYRPIKNDGNSFYRAFTFQILERIFELKGTAAAAAMIDAFDQQAQYYFDFAMFLPEKYQDLARAVAILREWSARSSQLVGVGAALIKKEWGANSPESDAVVKALRLITSAYIRYKLGNRPVASVRSIERMGEDAKDDAINALADVFGGFVNITNLTPTKNKTINRTSGIFGPKPFSFLYHADHYDIIIF